MHCMQFVDIAGWYCSGPHQKIDSSVQVQNLGLVIFVKVVEVVVVDSFLVQLSLSLVQLHIQITSGFL